MCDVNAALLKSIPKVVIVTKLTIVSFVTIVSLIVICEYTYCMSKHIEVELRGRLAEVQYAELRDFLEKNGVHTESQDREMLLLRDYPGFSHDFATREVDIRLRNTNGKCEIMLKKKVGEGENVSREEISLGLTDTTLDTARTVLRALGCKEARWMHRLKDVYTYDGVEWSLVTAPPSDIRYFEVEVVVESEADIPAARAKVEAQASDLGLTILDEAGSRALIGELNEKANKLVEV